jgi:DNA-binding MarR family transcriptional regulator
MDCGSNLGYLLSKAARMTKWDFNNTLAEEGITFPQWRLLKDIDIHEKQCRDEEERLKLLTPAAIAERLNADRPTVSCMLERLVKQEYVYRLSHPKDRRSQIILLTDKAKGLMPKLELLSERILQKAVEGFDEEETLLLKKFLNRIIHNLQC